MVTGDNAVLEQVRKQLQKLVHVIKVWDIHREKAIEREHALIKWNRSVPVKFLWKGETPGVIFQSSTTLFSLA